MSLKEVKQVSNFRAHSHWPTTKTDSYIEKGVVKVHSTVLMLVANFLSVNIGLGSK